MTRRQLLGAALTAAFTGRLAAARKPNIVIILADDLGYGDLGCYGSEHNRTPNLDALAKNGLRFTDFHSNGAVCSPTRAAFVTGRYQQRAGIDGVVRAADMRDKGLAPSQVTFAEVLKAAGYRTGIFGKWHLGYQPEFNPDKQGFDEFRGYVSGNVDYFSHVDQAGHPDWWNNSKQEPEEGYTTDLVTKHALRFIEQNAKQPFCLYLPYETVHSPFQGRDGKPFRVAGSTKAKEPASTRTIYADMIAAMDEGIGKVTGKLRALGLEKDTLVFFFSDNGGTKAGSNGKLRGHKGTLWEGGHRVPAIAYWPGRIRAGETKAVALGMDLFPTMLEIAGAKPPGGLALDGISLLPHLTSRKPLPERTLFWGFEGQMAARRGRWKLTLMPHAEPFLADLEADPTEAANLAGSRPEIVRELQSALTLWQQSVTASAAT